MASQQYSLRWNNYVRHMTSAFESLRSDRDLIDVTLSCEGKKIPAHKMLLSACSSYFKDLFKENPCQHPVIIFRNVTFDDLMALVDFMYNGEVNVEQEQLASFLHTAELLQVQGLTNSNKDPENKTKKTAKQDDRVPAPEVQFDEDGHPSPYQSDERTSTPTRNTGPPAAKKRKWQSPSRTASPAEVQAITQGASSGGEGEDGEPHQMEDVPLKTEAPDYEDDEDEQASGADDGVEEQESIIAKIQKSDQLILTTSTSRSRASNSDHSLFGGNVMDMLSTSESGDMSFVMAGPSNENMGQEGMQEIKEEVLDETDGLGASQSDYYLEPQLVDPFACEIAPCDQLESEEALAMNSFSPVIDNAYSLIEGVSAEFEVCLPHLDPEGTVLECDGSGRVAKFVIRRRESRNEQNHVVQEDFKLSSRKEPERRQPSRKGKDSVAYFEEKHPALNLSKQISKKYRLKRNLDAAKVKCKEEKNRDSFINKILRGKRGEGEFICEQCQYRFHTSHSLSLHYAVHSGETTCPVCARVFSRKDDMQMHLYCVHYGDKQLISKVGNQRQCWLCPVRVRSPYFLRVHVAREHMDFKVCPLCVEKFSTKASMLQHLMECHTHNRAKKK